MDFSEILDTVVGYYHDYPLIVAGVAIALLVWAYMKPKQAFKGLLFVAFVAVVFYMVSYMREGTGSSISVKEKMIHKTEKALE